LDLGRGLNVSVKFRAWLATLNGGSSSSSQRIFHIFRIAMKQASESQRCRPQYTAAVSMIEEGSVRLDLSRCVFLLLVVDMCWV